MYSSISVQRHEFSDGMYCRPPTCYREPTGGRKSTHYCRIVSPLSPAATAAVHCHRCQVSKHHRPHRIKAPLKPHQCAQRSVPSVPSCRMNTLSGSWALDYWATRHGKACRFLPIHFSGPSIATVSVCVCVCVRTITFIRSSLRPWPGGVMVRALD